MMKKYIALSAISIENLKTLKYQAFFLKYWFFLLSVISVTVKMKQYLKKQNQLAY